MAHVRPSFKKRLHAWWEGYELAIEESAGAAPPPDDGAAAARIEVLQQIFGAGFTQPGGESAVADLMSAIALDSESNLLEIGAGLGGGARAIARQSGAWVIGAELDPVLAEAGTRQSEDHALKDKARIDVLDPAAPGFLEDHFRGVFIHDTLYRIENPEEFIAAAVGALQPGGRLVISDLCLTETDDPDALARWHEGEPGEAYPLDRAKILEALEAAGMTVGVTEDRTEAYRADLLQAWGDFVTRIERQRPQADRIAILMAEAERWARRLTALQSGDIAIQHIVAEKP